MKVDIQNLLRATALAGFCLIPGLAGAETIHATIGASHPPAVPWVGQISKSFVPGVNAKLEAAGSEYRLDFTEAYSGQLYKANETVTALSDGLADIGWVFSLVESSRLPLTQVTGYTPGVLSDPVKLIKIFNDLNESVPALKDEWTAQNLVFLSATAGDSHQLFTNFPVKSLADLNGRKLSAPGTVGNWLQGTGAIPVDGTAASFYTDAATGLTEGATTVLTVAEGIKYTEVAPYVTITNLGSTYFGGLVANMDFWNGLPEEVQIAIRDAAHDYSVAVGEEVLQREAAFLEKLRTEGPTMSPPVTVTEMSAEDLKTWFAAMPNVPAAWVEASEARGLAAGELLQTYMKAARDVSATPLRDWDVEMREAQAAK
ncbi:C4-dicarboxylate TRAP transporter substrate-binding protein [Phaeovulum sp. W22_SRMD_FR3]|uniref:C4-dicarboxylate TRAP transporter substrate-binding protein n=1 Tax=Phaeovulum sp. W22_SRMD_FR3 TaxID=3240274 RepID=UPI003F9865ED